MSEASFPPGFRLIRIKELEKLQRQLVDAGRGSSGKVRTTWKCRWVPRRTKSRRYTAKDAGRVKCLAVKNGATPAAIERAYRTACPETQRSRGDLAEEAAAEAGAEGEIVLQESMNVIAKNTELLSEYAETLIVVGAIIAVISVVIKVIGKLVPKKGALALASFATKFGEKQVAEMIKINIMQRAANDAAFRQISNTLVKLKKAA